MEVVFYPHGRPPGETKNKRMWVPGLRDDDKIEYAANPKRKGSIAYGLYQRYKNSKTFAEAKKNGARSIDFAFDSNWGYLKVTDISTVPESRECEVAHEGEPCSRSDA